AVDVLVSEARVLRHKGRGARVLELPIVYPVHAASAYSKTLSAMGYRSQAMLLARCERVAQVSEAKALRLAPGERVLEIQTLRLLNEQPISLITHCFSARHCRLLDGYEGGSVRQHLAQQEIALTRTSTLI